MVRSDELVTQTTQTLVFEDCFICGIAIAMTRDQRRQFNEKGLTITCVLGHRTMRRESDNQRLQRALERAQDRVTALETDRRNYQDILDVELKKRKKLESRVRDGVCPHCHRSFQNLKRHLASKHGDPDQ